MSTETWILAGGLESVSPVAEGVRALALPVLGEEGAGEVELALVEALTNVIRHGYGPEGGPVRVEASALPPLVTLRISDWGRPIPGEALAGAGLSRFDFDPDDLAELPEGGMGLSLITVLMDDVAYRSDQGQNTLTLVRGVRG
jgi:serine/threonine-protein kinase RsbW